MRDETFFDLKRLQMTFSLKGLIIDRVPDSDRMSCPCSQTGSGGLRHQEASDWLRGRR